MLPRHRESQLRSRRWMGVGVVYLKGLKSSAIGVFEVQTVCTVVSGSMQRGGHFAAGRQVGRDKLHTLGQAVVPYGPKVRVQACLGRAQVMVEALAGQGATGQQALPASGVRAMASALRSRTSSISSHMVCSVSAGPRLDWAGAVWKRCGNHSSSAATKCVAFTHAPRNSCVPDGAVPCGCNGYRCAHGKKSSLHRKYAGPLRDGAGHHQRRWQSWLTTRCAGTTATWA